MSEVEVVIQPRVAFRPYLERQERWSCIVAHRRAGKTFSVIQDLILRALTYTRKGPNTRYAYIAPTRDQAKDIAWSYLKQFTHAIPGVVINESDLKITLPDGQLIRLYSGENYERMRGVYFDGVVIDEMGDISPQAWSQVIRPCLSDYKGWATFIGTPKGKNAFYKIHRMAIETENWFSMVLKSSDSGIIPTDELEDLKRSTPLDDFNQEYECDFNIGRAGSIYADKVMEAWQAGRVCEFDVSTEALVHTTWDLGSPQNTVVLYWQQVGFTYRVIDCDHSMTLTTAERVAHMMAKGYNYGVHLLPHDSKKTEYDALSFETKLKQAGLANIRPIPRQPYRAEDKRIQTMYDIFGDVWFRKQTLADEGNLLDALQNYHRKQKLKGDWITNTIEHDWSSHFCDAFGSFGEALKNRLIPGGNNYTPNQPTASMPVRSGRSSRHGKQTKATM